MDVKIAVEWGLGDFSLRVSLIVDLGSGPSMERGHRRISMQPGNGMTIIDGIVRTQRSRNTPPATRVPEIVGR